MNITRLGTRNFGFSDGTRQVASGLFPSAGALLQRYVPSSPEVAPYFALRIADSIKI